MASVKLEVVGCDEALNLKMLPILGDADDAASEAKVVPVFADAVESVDIEDPNLNEVTVENIGAEYGIDGLLILVGEVLIVVDKGELARVSECVTAGPAEGGELNEAGYSEPLLWVVVVAEEDAKLNIPDEFFIDMPDKTELPDTFEGLDISDILPELVSSTAVVMVASLASTFWLAVLPALAVIGVDVGAALEPNANAGATACSFCKADMSGAGPDIVGVGGC